MINIKAKAPYFVGCLKAVIFGLTYLFISRLLGKISMFDLLAFRFLFAVIAFEIARLLHIIKIEIKGKKIGGLVFLSALQPIGYYIFETLGVERISTLLCGVLISAVPLIIMVMESMILKEKTNGAQKCFILLCVSGVLLISVLSSAGAGGATSVLGMLFILLSMLCEGGYNVLSRKKSAEFSPTEITYIMMWISALVFNGINVAIHLKNGTIGSYFTPLLDISCLGPLLYLGVAASFLAYILYNYMLSKIQASSVGVFAGISTIVTVLSGVFLNHEHFFWFHAVGMACIILGVWGTNYFKFYDSQQHMLEDEIYREQLEKKDLRG